MESGIMNSEELRAIAEKETEARGERQYRVACCTAAGCLSSDCAEVKAALQKAVTAAGLAEKIEVGGTGCLGLCHAGPLVQVDAGASSPAGAGTWLYQHVTPELAEQIVKDHLVAGQPIQKALCAADDPFFKHQKRIVLENSGKADPERIESYIGAGGYEALLKALTEMTPQDVIQQITASGLRGRGGGGYPTGLKWSTVAKSRGTKKYVICNADEGDPGAFMDRSVLEGDPHRILEGMTIAAYAIGAEAGYIYVRGEYPLAISRLKTAIRQAERMQLLGNRILESGFNFRVDLRIGAGAFVCGEETALIASIEGKRGSPRPRPPYPAEKGLWGCPTLINNVETFANVPPIVLQGGAWYASIGTAKSKGTKVFALAGKIENTGLIEVPMGMSLRQIIFEVGGGIPNGRQFKAAQTGGPSGGCIPAEHLDLPVDYESLMQVGSIMGSGGLIVMDDTSCMVDVAQFFMEFCRDESCGKCVPCRAGTVQMHELLMKITSGQATMDDLQMLEELADLLKNTSLCGLGQTAPNPVVSTLRYFRDEYLAHINDKRCPAGVCQMNGGALEKEARS
jgi:bidirectional [NiFe] hydrogenase diaphorase subunit